MKFDRPKHWSRARLFLGSSLVREITAATRADLLAVLAKIDATEATYAEVYDRKSYVGPLRRTESGWS